MLTLVSPDNFERAESDMYFASLVKRGGFGKFLHTRKLIDIENQAVVRPNRDTLYSSAVFDLHAGPATITLPDAGDRFMSMISIDEDQYARFVFYDPGAYTFSRDNIGTRYVLIGIRTFVDANDPKDLAAAQALQDAIRIAPRELGRFEVPDWDPASQTKVREALRVLGETVRDSGRMFGTEGEIDRVRHLIGTAIGWGGNPERDAKYMTFTPAHNDGRVVHTMSIKNVPVDGFWSISVYNAKGYFEPNDDEAYSINGRTAKRTADGTVVLQFGGEADELTNVLPIVPGWNYTVRLYRPREEILSGEWTFPEAQPLLT